MLSMTCTALEVRLVKPTNRMLVKVYKNLHRDCFSVVALEGEYKGRVIAHAKSVVLTDATTRVSEAGRQRVLREKRKNVHATVVGFIRMNVFVDTSGLVGVSYNPYKAGHFYFKASELPFHGSSLVVLDENGISSK